MTRESKLVPDGDWQADWDSHRQWQLTASMHASPAERLAWLEEAIELAWKCGAHPALHDARRSPQGEKDDAQFDPP
jgi:hypothetical protein